MNNRFYAKLNIEEGYAVILSFAYFFCILSAYYIMRPLRDQLAVEVGSSKLPGFFATTFIATLLLTPMFAWAVTRWPRRLIIPFIYLFFIGCQLVFLFLYNDRNLISVRTYGLVFYVWVSIFNLFVVSVFWSFMTDIWSDKQSRRLFPIIALGGTTGAIIGPIVTSSLVEAIGFASLLIVSAILLMVAVVCVILLGNWARKYGSNRNKSNNEAALGGGMLDGLKQIFTNPFVRSMSLMMLLSDAIGTIGYVLITDYSGIAYPNNPILQTRFAANLDLSTNIIQILVQLTATRWLLVRYGAGMIFALWACIVVAACLTVTLVNNPYSLAIGIMPWIALMLIITRSLSYGMLQSARETLYTLVPRDVRYKGKNAVDTVVWRAGDVASLMSINAFRALGVNITGFGLICAAIAATSGLIGWRLAKSVEKAK